MNEGVMVSKCANPSCAASFRYMQEGKLFRAEIEIENEAGRRRRKTHCFWLCSTCSQTMMPRIDVSGSVVSVRLFRIVTPTIKQ